MKTLSRLGARLRELGLRQALVHAALGARTALHAASRRNDLVIDFPSLSLTPAGALIAMLVAGHRLSVAAANVLGRDLASLIDAGILFAGGAEIWAEHAILPHGRAYVCAPWDALPDDSSHHLCGALPSRPARWLDVGTGSGIAPLCCATGPATGTDIDPQLVECARRGAALSGIGDVDFAVADLFSNLGERRFELVTFNAPIEGAPALLARFWSEVGAHVAQEGAVIVHSIADPGAAALAALDDLDGTLIRCRYTPAEHRPSFAVWAWYPGLTRARVERAACLTATSPYARKDWISPEDFG